MVVSSAFQAQVISGTLKEAASGRQYAAVQNHDLVNSVCVTFGGNPAVISTPNGMVVKAGEFGQIKGRVGAKLTIISENLPVKCTLFVD